MKTARIFMSGHSRALRLPKEFCFKSSKVEIFRRGEEVVLREIPMNAAEVFGKLAELSEDFLKEGRKDAVPQKRELFE